MYDVDGFDEDILGTFIAVAIIGWLKCG